MYTTLIPVDVEHQILTNNIFERNGKIVFSENKVKRNDKHCPAHCLNFIDLIKVLKSNHRSAEYVSIKTNIDTKRKIDNRVRYEYEDERSSKNYLCYAKKNEESSTENKKL